MVKARVPETADGIQGEFDVMIYDNFMRGLRNRGWLETKDILASGIDSGTVLELGPGPGYLGLDWLRRTTGTHLTGLDISPNMLAVARKNAREYGLEDRVKYVAGNAAAMPFADNAFDAVFSNGSLHEWEAPVRILSEVARVLKPGGRYCVTDMKRNMNPLVSSFLWLATRPAEIRPYLRSSIAAAYTHPEIVAILSETPLGGACVAENPMGLVVSGQKAAG
jgi:ubiquinone/menaquinone biosynthesis C-methylase UbiE